MPTLKAFKVLRVLGEGAFGQVIEVKKRDCGVSYAMKVPAPKAPRAPPPPTATALPPQVLKKRAMGSMLGRDWRERIGLEAEIMAELHHPFMVNL